VLFQTNFRYNPNLKVGDTVEVLIDIREDKTGQPVLSHEAAQK
jgi:small subunit ribosomal protein S1